MHVFKTLSTLLPILDKSLHPLNPKSLNQNESLWIGDPNQFTSHAKTSNRLIVYATVSPSEYSKCPACSLFDSALGDIFEDWSTECEGKAPEIHVVDCSTRGERELCDELSLRSPGLYAIDANPAAPTSDNFSDYLTTNVSLSRIYTVLKRGERAQKNSRVVQEIRSSILWNYFCPPHPATPLVMNFSRIDKLIVLSFWGLAVLAILSFKKSRERIFKWNDSLSTFYASYYSVSFCILYLVGLSGIMWSLLVQWQWTGVNWIIPSRNMQYSSEPLLLLFLILIGGFSIQLGKPIGLSISFCGMLWISCVKAEWFLGTLDAVKIIHYSKLDKVYGIWIRILNEMRN